MKHLFSTFMSLEQNQLILNVQSLFSRNSLKIGQVFQIFWSIQSTINDASHLIEWNFFSKCIRNKRNWSKKQPKCIKILKLSGDFFFRFSFTKKLIFEYLSTFGNRPKWINIDFENFGIYLRLKKNRIVIEIGIKSVLNDKRGGASSKNNRFIIHETFS